MRTIKIFVFDTNSLISAHLLPNSVNRLAYDTALTKGVIAYSRATLSEFVQVFSRPKFDKYLSLTARSEAITRFEREGFLIDVKIQIADCRDQTDNKFLELAVTSGARCLVTGDKDLLVMHPYRAFDIISPSDFLKMF
ncbi:MAG: putative toxin-antitoxin system toxin component, PIN family [Bacteroidota bacterium]